ncbi:hypothetical protein [Corynebacterium tapiri]|uniref:hypothetical protein n=1 Tax=Corynebacterium tapiri TaxID=1448266 RepID=UPI0015D5D5F7|nr:hypothetical protein [Corynebacterium tapiri]
MISQVTIDRVVSAMKAHGIELTIHEEAPSASANLNGFPVTIACIGSVVIVRTDSLTDTPTSAGDARLYLAANHLNGIQMEASVAIVDLAETLVVRTEHEIFCAAGMTDEQLSAALKTAVDGVLGLQDAMVVTAEEMGKLASSTSEN